MNKKTLVCYLLASLWIVIVGGCVANKPPQLKGGYQSEHVDGYIVQMSFQPDDNSFIEYIDNREVDKGTYEELKQGVYKINGDRQELEMTLNNNNSFNIVVKGLNGGNPIQLKNIDSIPMYFSTIFDDVDEYILLLE